MFAFDWLSTRFQSVTEPPAPLISEIWLPLEAPLPICSVPPVTFCTPERMSTSSVVLLPFAATIKPPDQFSVVAVPSSSVYCGPASIVWRFMVPPFIVNVPAEVPLALLMPPVTVSTPASICSKVDAKLPSMIRVPSVLPTFITPPPTLKIPPLIVTSTVVVTVAALLSQKPPVAGIVRAARRRPRRDAARATNACTCRS